MYKELFLLPTENLAVLPGDRNRFSVSKGLQQKTKAQVSVGAKSTEGFDQGCSVSGTQTKQNRNCLPASV